MIIFEIGGFIEGCCPLVVKGGFLVRGLESGGAYIPLMSGGFERVFQIWSSCLGGKTVH